jgi:signal transduction histidine kinase/CheY-like chemotaxis protein
MTAAAAQPDLDAEELFLSTAPARPQWRSAAMLVALLVIGFVATAPFAARPLPRVFAFIPVYESALAILDLLTAIMLYGQFAVLRSAALLVLAAGYLFCAEMAVAHALSFPGLFAAHGLLGANPQTTAWLYMFWHGGFPLAVIAYALLNRGDGEAAALGVAPPAAVTASVAAASGIVVAITWLTTAGAAALPAIMLGDHHTPVYIVVVATVWLLSPLGVGVLWRRRPLTLLDLWLVAILVAWTFDIGLAAVLSAGRFDLGFYVGRIFGLAATGMLLTGMLLETTRLYGRLARETARLGGRVGTLEARAQAHRTQLQRSDAALAQEKAEHKRTEAQLVQAQKMEAIGNLTGGMAHDFNNLLGVVIGNLDLLRERVADDPESDELAGEALDSALRGADLTRRLLAFARRQPLQPETIDVNALVSRIVSLLQRLLGEDIAVSLDLAEDLWPVVADPSQLEAGIANLATNARDAMPRGGRLSIVTGNRRLDADYASQHAELAPGDYAMTEVSDTGSGMPPDVVSRIFEPFYTTKAQGKGTGLGLSMVYGFMKQSGGHINVYSEPGIGTTFRLYLPRADRGADEGAAAATAEAMPCGRGETVLVVEDNAALRRVAVRQLHDLGYCPFEAETAAAALDLLAHQPIDLLFSDVVLPGELDGIEMVRLARDRLPHLRAVLTSGFPGRPVGRGDFDARLLPKPYRKADLAHALATALGGGNE